MKNPPSAPATMTFHCPEHGPQEQAPYGYAAVCRCGRACEADVAGWLSVARQHYPDEGDFFEAASIVGIPAAQARAALAEL